MKVTIVVDNIEHAGIPGEWGFCAYIEQNGKKLLLDTGASNLFADNAEKLNIDLKDVDFAVLSHAHYDHANGMGKFFEINEKAPFYLQEGCGENCYFKKGFIRKYIGIPKGITKKYQDRIKYVSGVYTVPDGIYLVSRSTPHLEQIGKKEMMYQKTKLGWKPDNFCHEQSLVLDTDGGLVIFNSCSHGGVVNIINEVKAAFPNKKITAHKLRSTYGTSLYKETGDIYLVADVLGHKDVNTTKKHYAAIDEDRRRMAASAVKLRE